MRRCFQCGQRTDAAQLTAVGDGEFCAACFRLLLASEADAAPADVVKVDASKAEASKAGAAAAVAPNRRAAKATASKRCLVCERGIDGEAAISFLGGDICSACNAQMELELREGERAEAAERAAVRKAEGAPAAPASAQAASEAPVVSFTPGAETRWCAGCERPMPGPGSYRMLAGEPYCPACVPFYSVLNLGAHPRHPAAQASPAGSSGGSSAGTAHVGAPSATVCDCCGAALELGAELEAGFRFCKACFTSDRELALGVARARHRRKLEALRAAIDTGNKS